MVNCCPCTNVTRHTIVSVVGLSLSFFELILASVYNLQNIGLGMSIIGIITSGLYLHFNIKDMKKRSGSPNSSRIQSESDADAENRPMVPPSGTDIMREEQLREVATKQNRWHRILWIIYVCFTVFIGTLAFVRLVSLFRRITWRQDLNDKFPSECGSWATNGCTRVVLDKSGCTRADSITTQNSIIFNVNGVDRLLNTQIAQCVDQIKGAKLMSPRDLEDLDTNGNLIHITFNSAIFGFIDDMYMMSNIYYDGLEKTGKRVVSSQSQLRMGSYDFDQNYDHIKLMMDCLNNTFMNSGSTPAPCSATD